MPQEKIGRLVLHTRGGGIKYIRPGHFIHTPRISGPAERIPVFFEDWLIVQVDQKGRTPKLGSIGSKHDWTSFRVELTTNGRPASKQSDGPI